MLAEIRPPMWYPFHRDEDEIIRFQVASVGVWVIVNKHYFLVVQQADKAGLPWGVPAGHVAEGDSNAREVARRELREETGIGLEDGELNYLTFVSFRRTPRRGHLLFLVKTSLDKIPMGNSCQDSDGTIRFVPPLGVDVNEISQLALIPLEDAFGDNLLNRNAYHFPETYRGYTALRRLGFIQGSFPFENDPGL